MKKIFKRKDLILIIAILLIISLLFIFFSRNTSGATVRVLRDNEVIETIALDQDGEYVFSDEDEVNTLVISDQTAEVISANCSNQVCVNTKAISQVGEVIACLPHGLIFEIVE